MHPVFQNGGRGGRGILVKNLAEGQKILLCIMSRVNVLKGVQRSFGENKKMQNCSIINKKHASKDLICPKVN